VFYVTTDGLHGLIASKFYCSGFWYDAQDFLSSEITNFGLAFFTDWRLPTRSELGKLFIIKKVLNMEGTYWSSTEYGNTAWCLDFTKGVPMFQMNKFSPGRIKGVRSF